MKSRHTKKFNWRAFTSVFVVFSFIIMGFSGLILFITPPGRVAYWTNWQILWLTKEAWGSVHTIFSIFFIVMGSFHLYFNWRPFLSYMRSKVHGGVYIRREFAFSGVLALAILAFTLAELPPFSSIIDLSDAISDSWATEQEQPPVPHAELMRLEEFSKAISTPLDVLKTRLEMAGIHIDHDEVVIKELAEKNGLTPAELYKKIQSLPAVLPAMNRTGGSGYGRMTIRDVSQKLNLSVDTALEILKDQGVEAGPEANLRDLATRYKLLPYEIVSLLDKYGRQAENR